MDDPTSIEQLTTPALVIDKPTFDANCTAMDAVLPGLKLRPHVEAFKSTDLTHRPARRPAAGRRSSGRAARIIPSVDPPRSDTHHTDGMPLITGRGIVKRYGSFTALDGVDLDIDHGITGLLGANGAGKTTLLGMILGLHPVDEGTIEVLGHDPRTAGPEIRTRLGYAPEHHTLPPDVAALDFVTHVAELHGLPGPEAATRSSDALWLVGLAEERFRPMGTMSTGQRQRVKLAQAIAHDPRLIMLDEPTDGLDPVQRDEMLRLIRSVSERYQIDVVLSSHLLGEVEQICDGVVIIGEGRTLVQGRVDDLRAGSAGVVVELDEPVDVVDTLARRLEAGGVPTTADGRTLIVSGDDDVVFDLVRDEVAAAGLAVHRLHRRRLSLEDLFLDRLG